jgi:hypothetical protein
MAPLDPMQGRWLQHRESVQRRWTALTAADLDDIAGLNDRLAYKLQERYGYSFEEAVRQVLDFISVARPERRRFRYAGEYSGRNGQ